MQKSTKIILLILIVVIILFLPFPTTITVKVPYQEEVKEEVPVNYDYEHYYHSVGLFDWELEYVITIENVDNTGGTFTVTVKFYDGNTLVYVASDRKYIGPGQTETFRLRSKGLSYSTDWETRYRVVPDIDPPTKIVTHFVTKYKTEYRTIYVNLIQLLLGKWRG